MNRRDLLKVLPIAAEMKESDLAKPVADWLRDQGYIVYGEVPFPCASFAIIDLVGRRDRKLICVELKISLTQTVIRQAYLSSLITPYVYVAVASNPRRSSIDRCCKQNIGALRVKTNGKVSVICTPELRHRQPLGYDDKCHECLDVMEPSDRAGIPNLAGEGPAQLLYPIIAAFRKNRPAAKWREVWKNIPNHYASPFSLASGMRAVEERERLKRQRGGGRK